jgi:hypothetical protein
MMPRLALLLTLTVLAAAGPPGLRAQSARELVASGLSAYRAVRYDGAVQQLRQALNVEGDDALPDSVRATAYAYLAAAEYYRGHADDAAAATRQALLTDPSYRPDTLVFPPDVTDAFESVRRLTRYVRIQAPADTIVQPGGRGYPVRLYVSAAHELTAALIPEGGTPRVFYDGAVRDSADIVWPALERGARSPTGRFVLEIRSRLPGGGARVVRLPLEARPIRADTLPEPVPPADSLFLPERAARRSTVPSASLALLAGAATMLLPTLVAKDGVGSRTRYALGASLGVAGIVAFFTGSRPDPLPANAAVNRALMDAWRRDADGVRAENERRRGRTALRIVAGPTASTDSSR